MTPDPLLHALCDFLRIPSVSSGAGDARGLADAAAWVAGFVEDSGGEAAVLASACNPVVTGTIRCGRRDAPVVLLYGHYDVQSPEPLAGWTTDPFAPDIRDGRVYARGATDDKGQLLALLIAARDLARAGELPVDVRVLVDGEEEIGGPSAERWLRADADRTDVAIAFDSRMPDPWTPVLVTSARGAVHVGVDVSTGEADLHSGAGNTVLNAAHVLSGVLGAVLPDRDGRLPAPLQAGCLSPSAAERDGWSRLPAAADAIAALGGRPHDPGALSDRYGRMGFAPSIDVHGIETGDARQVRTQIPHRARAMLSMRLAPGQTSAAMWPVLEQLLLAAVPPGADVTVTLNNACEPARVDPDHPATRLAVAALTRAAGVEPTFVPAGGSLPVLAGLAARGIPAILSGFGTLDSRVHACDESIRLDCLQLAHRAARELLLELGGFESYTGERTGSDPFLSGERTGSDPFLSPHV